MQVYNSASSTMGKTDMSSQEISAHNSTFEAYEGRVKGSQVKSLLNAIQKNNEEYEDRTINVTGKGAGENAGEVDISAIKNSTTYKVTFKYEGNDGLISECDIQIYGTTETTE